MRTLRILTNALVAGALGAAYIAVLVLQLNPQLPLEPLLLLRLYIRLALLYAPAVAATLSGLLLLHRFLVRRRGMPGWLSLRILAWVTTILCAGAALLMWRNLVAFRAELGEETARRLAAGTAGMSAAALVLLLIAIVHYSFGRRGSRVGGSLYALAVLASLLLPLVARGSAEPLPPRGAGQAARAFVPEERPPGKVVVLLVNGASLEYINPATAQGRLPNFGRLLDAGASLHLSTVRPTEPETVWAAVATGKYPSANGVRAAASYAFGAGLPPLELLPAYCGAAALTSIGAIRAEPLLRTALRAPALWEILSAAGLRVGIVNWPLTAPAPWVRGFLVSDRLHLRVPGASPARVPEPLAAPSDAAQIADRIASELSIRSPSGRHSGDPSTWRDVLYEQIFLDLDRRFAPHVVALRYEAFDRVRQTYSRAALPRFVGGPSATERRRARRMLDEYYAYIDGKVGAAIDRLGDDDLLLVISGYGMEPVGLVAPLISRLTGEAGSASFQEQSPDGFLLAYGQPVRASRPHRGSAVDVLPTLLYFLGLPVARDMDGFARTDLFKASFTAERPVVFVPTYSS
ncbi:MAG: alkaline phosphatase family protein [Vicinamibacteraceae bacterium]